VIRQVTMDVAIVDPTEAALARHDLVVDPPVGDQVRDDQAMEGHAATTPQVVQLAASQHPVPTGQHVPIAATGQHVPSATTVRDAQNVADSATAVHAAMDHPRSACGPKAELRRAETATQANASLKRIAIPSASARFVRTTRHPRFPRESRPKCLTALLSMS